MARDLNKFRRLGLWVGLVRASLSFLQSLFILIYINKLTVSYGGQEYSHDAVLYAYGAYSQ